VPVTRIAAPGKSCAAASTRGLSTDHPSPASSPKRSPVLGVPLTSLGGLAAGARLCPAPHDPRLATPALSRPLVGLEPARNAWSSCDCQGSTPADPGHVAG